MFRPLHDWVLVKRAPPEEKIGSLFIPGAAREKAEQGEVIAVGRGRHSKNGVLVPTTVVAGTHIAFGKYSGEDIVIDGQEYVTMREMEILGVLHTKPMHHAPAAE